mmetsp:Transcript_26373/g.19781  ORF Transcript_26373/g.19781 Transcript_26373/m.19781 type:complete len:127 (-) Transcript_26373:196-576(-)
MYWPFLWCADKIMPTKAFPELAFFFIVILFFFSTEYVLKVIDVLSVYVSLSHIFVGITVLSWGACSVELINMTIAVHNNEFQLGVTAVVGSMVLVFSFMTPAAIIYKMIVRGSLFVDLIQEHHTSA